MGYVGLSAKNDIRINATSDLELTSDNTTIKFGADDDVTITHDPDDGLIFKSIATADDNPFLLTIQTGETDLATNTSQYAIGTYTNTTAAASAGKTWQNYTTTSAQSAGNLAWIWYDQDNRRLNTNSSERFNVRNYLDLSSLQPELSNDFKFRVTVTADINDAENFVLDMAQTNNFSHQIYSLLQKMQCIT